MRRTQAFLLLVALLAGATSALAQAAYDSTEGCCADGICPVHPRQELLSISHGKSHCESVPDSMMCCQANCRSAKEPAKVLLSPMPDMVLHAAQALPALENLRRSTIALFLKGSPGFVSSSEQPPRL